MKRGPRVAIAGAAGLLASVVAGTIYAAVAARGDLDASMLADEPSQKARILAEHISEAMNGSAFVALFVIPIAIVLAWRMPRRSARNGAVSRDA